MFLKAYLPFLPGYPIPDEYSHRNSATGTAWHGVGENGDVVLTPESIRLANYGWNELQKFPRVFPKAVEDHAAWQRVVPWMLDMLGKSVYGKIELPDSLWTTNLGFSKTEVRYAAEMEKSEPKLKFLLDAVSWLAVLQPAHASSMLKWFEAARKNIAHILENWPGVDGIELVLLLFRLVEQDGSVRLTPILETLGMKNARNIATNSDSFRTGWNNVLTAVAQRTRMPKSFTQPQKEFKMEPPAKPAGDWTDTVYEFTKRIARQPTKQRRQSLELFAEYIPPNLVERWRLWWDELEPIVQNAEKLVARVRRGTFEDNEKRSRQAKEIQRRLGELFQLAPPLLNHWAPSEWILDHFHNWDDLAWKPYQKSIRALAKTLPVEYRQQASRLKMFVVLYRRFLGPNHDDMSGLDISMILDEIRHWDIPRHGMPMVLDVDWPETYAGNRDELERIGKSLCYWFADLDQTDSFYHVVELAKILQDETRINLFSRVLARKEHRDNYYADSTIQAAAKLAENEKEFTQLLGVLKNIDKNETEYIGGNSENLAVLTSLLIDTPWRDELRETFLNDEVSGILDIAESVAALEKRKIFVPLPAPLEPIAADWIQRYPICFADALRHLASLTPDAERIAIRKLESLTFAPDKMEAEIHTLEGRLVGFPDSPANPRIRRRIDNLRERLKTGPTAAPTEARIRRLRKKIVERTRRVFFEHLRRSSRNLLEQTLCRELDIAAIPESWWKPLHRKIVLGILDLDTKPIKRLGIKLLRSIARTEIWNYRGESRNVEFMNHLEEQGIEIEPWLVPAPEERFVSEDNPPLLLGFENDPMEIMKMGAIFGTCLSPWDFNFFSTVANTVDVNKRVLYGRDMKGTIKARCLVALTDGGELLAFRAYAHHKSLDFRNIVAKYLERLAKRMNTVVVDKGVVSSLVSPEWYDDGSITIGELFSFLKDGSAFRKMLPTMEPLHLVPVLEKELAPHPLRPFILSPFLVLPEVEKRPELVIPLLPYVSSALSTDDLARMIKCIFLAGEKREAARLTKQYMISRLERWFVDEYWQWKPMVFELAGILPDVLLPHVRRLGSRGTKKLDEDQANDRRELLVLIYESLGRKRKAKRIER